MNFDWNKLLSPDKYRLERTARLSVGILWCSICVVAYLPKIVPQSLSFFIPVWFCVIFKTAPLVAFSILGFYPVYLMTMLTATGFITMLLCGATVSTGLFMGVFSIYVVWIMALQFGEDYDKTFGLLYIFLGLTGMLTLSLRPAVEEGGLEALAALWTEQGLQNPQAYFRNLLIAFCWPAAAHLVPLLCFPVRTARNTIASIVLPGMYKQILAVLDGSLDKNSLSKSSDALKDGAIAGLAIYEVRFGRSSAVTELTALVTETNHLLLEVLGFDAKQDDKQADIWIESSKTVLGVCAKALSSYSAADIQELEKIEELESTSSPNMESYFVYDKALSVRKTALDFLHVNNVPRFSETFQKHRWSDLGKSAKKVFVTPFFMHKAMFKNLLILFQPKLWTWWRVGYAFKRSAGFMVLICMIVFWPSYANFRIGDPSDVGPVYYGWDCYGYVCAWTATLEGTYKKGISRVFGTCFAGLFAWLGIIICSGSYDEEAPMNAYGTAAYLTVVETTLFYLQSAKGVSARLGACNSAKDFFTYFQFPMALIMSDAYVGSGNRDDLVVNRVVATITGVAMCMVFQAIPPFKRGGDPKYSLRYWEELNTAFQRLIGDFLDGKGEIAPDHLLSAAQNERKRAKYLLQDAERLLALNFWNPDQRLEPLLADLHVTETYLGWLELHWFSEGEMTDDDRTYVRHVLEASKGDQPKQKVDDEENGQALPLSNAEAVDTKTRVVKLTHVIESRLQKHKEVLDSLVSGSSPSTVPSTSRAPSGLPNDDPNTSGAPNSDPSEVPAGKQSPSGAS